MASVTTYSLISSRRISSLVWSTLMTSSIRRWMSFAKRILISPLNITEIPSKDFWAIIMLGCKDPHEPEPGSPVEIAWVKQDRGDGDPSLQLLQQRERAINGKQGA